MRDHFRLTNKSARNSNLRTNILKNLDSKKKIISGQTTKTQKASKKIQNFT